MLRLLADENFNGAIVRGLRRRCPQLDLVRVQDVGLLSASDEDVLEWAAREERILLTHDYQTIPKHAFERLSQKLPLAGVFLCDANSAPLAVIQDLQLLDECSTNEEWSGQVHYLPL